MNLIFLTRPLLACVVILSASAARGQHDHSVSPADYEPNSHAAPASDSSASKPSGRFGDPYPLDTCPISGNKLGAMGDADIKVYDGREVRFCCSMCEPKFEKDLPASFAKLDAKIEQDQAPLYPLTTSVVTGKPLPAEPFEFVYGNRLVRLGAESEKEAFLQDPAKYFAALNAAAIKAQAGSYPLTKCPVSDEDLGGAMGEADSVVVGGRVIQICCSDCKSGIEQDPAKYINMVDQARNAKPAAPDVGSEKQHKQHGRQHGDH